MGLLLAGAYRSRWPVFWGMTLAYALLEGAAVLAGEWVGGAAPKRLVIMGAGLLFVGFGAAALRFAEEAEEEARGWLERVRAWGPFAVSLAATSAAEFGDRTQLACAALAAESGRPWTVWAASVSALAFLNLLTVFLGDWIAARLDMAKLQRAGGVVFLAAGAALLVQGFRLP